MKKVLKVEAAKVKNISLQILILLQRLRREGYIKTEDIERLIAFRNNPSDESGLVVQK